MVRRRTKQHTEALVHAQESPVAAGEGLQLGVAFEHECGPLGRAELSKPLVSLWAPLTRRGSCSVGIWVG